MKVLNYFCLGLLISHCNGVCPRNGKMYYFPNDNGEILGDDLQKPQVASPYQTKEKAAEQTFFRHCLFNDTGEPRMIEPNCSNNCLSGLLKNVPVVFIAHGFASAYNYNVGNYTRDGFRTRAEPMNLVFVDWSYLARPRIPFSFTGGYYDALQHVPHVGNYTADMISYIVSQNISTLSNISFIGHSLGAHVAHYVTANLKGSKLEHIIALDPAYPIIGQKNESERLSRMDANFVNVIHTACGCWTQIPLGIQDPIGHIDFYPNGGYWQNGCEWYDFYGKCSHSRSYEYLAESLSSLDAFPACKTKDYITFLENCDCDSNTTMGWDTVFKQPLHGEYFLKTNSERPFGKTKLCGHLRRTAVTYYNDWINQHIFLLDEYKRQNKCLLI